MKNKLKKILACACFALIGCTAVTGCSLTGGDFADLENSSLATSVENYINKITKDVVLDKINYTHYKFKVGAVDKVHATMSINEYDGTLYNYTKKSSSGFVDYTYKHDGDSNILQLIQNNGEDADSTTSIYKSNFTEDVHFGYFPEQSTDKFELFNPQQLDVTRLFDLDQFGSIFFKSFRNISKDNIGLIKVADNGKINCTIFTEEFDATEKTFTVNQIDIEITGDLVTGIYGVSKVYTYDEETVFEFDENDNIIISSMGTPKYTEGGDCTISTQETIASFEYDSYDFSELDSKIAQIEKTYLQD